MKKMFSLFLCSLFVCAFTSACNSKQPASLVKSERRFAKYMGVQNKSQGGTIDLSEGPKLKYNADFGPKAPSFEFKIVDPY